MNWFRQTVGLEDPIYGPSAIHSVAQQTEQTPFTELKKEDLKWFGSSSTAVETQTFYFNTADGHYGLAQVIYSNVGVSKTVQFTSKLFYPDPSTPFLWTSDALSSWSFSPDHYSFTATNVSLTLSPDGTSYHVRSSVSKKALIDLTFTRMAPGVMAGRNGTTTYGTDASKPWGSMRHAYWPRCSLSGSIVTPSGGAIAMTGRGMFVHALQGMRPNLSAATHNFANFQSPTYSAVLWEFTTPPSYGSTSVSVGCVAIDGQILIAGTDCTPTHLSSTPDAAIGWPEPTAAKFEWNGQGAQKGSKAVVQGELGSRVDRVDVLAEVPGFVKAIIAQAGGLKPYIYQFHKELPIQVEVEGQEPREEMGTLLMESTFISGGM